MTRITSLAICALMLGLFVISQSFSSPMGSPQNPALAGLEEEIKRVEAEIDRIFAETLAQLPSIPSDAGSRMKRVQTLGKLMLFDKQLSVNRNQACTFCHMPDVDFTGPISILNMTTVAYPGSVRNASADPAQSRYGHRKPQSYTYAPYFPSLQYNQTQGDFYGGNFWDLRATGVFLQNPAADQAQDPPVDPNEMGMSDTACVVRRLSQSPYRWFFEAVWGKQAFAINWPANVDQVCAKPGPPPADDPMPVHLSPEDRGRSNTTYDQFAPAIAAYEAAPDISPFSSKFDYALANPDQQVLTPDEQAGWDLFRGEELNHDYLWRCLKCLPERGRIGIFNRSYYEETLVVRVHPEILANQRLPPSLVTKDIWKERFQDIRGFERYLARNGMTILKFFLHVSKEEQKKRFLERIEEPEKNWKFSESDVKEREHWDDYMEAYEDMIRNTATKAAPWYVVPADNKWFARIVVAAAVIDALDSLDLKYPKADDRKLKELAAAKRALQAGK